MQVVGTVGMPESCIRIRENVDPPLLASSRRPPALSAAPMQPGDVALWVLSCQDLAGERSSLAASLSIDERARRDRFVGPELRSRFELFRGAIRHILGSYTGRPPSELVFETGAQGKPLLGQPKSSSPAFNLSHTDDAMVFACSLEGHVGVDVESSARATDVDGIAERFFHPNEQSVLHACTEADRRALFLRWWTAKEAYLKARGWGIADGLARLDFSLWRDQSSMLLDADDGSQWTGWAFCAGSLCGTVVTDQPVRKITAMMSPPFWM